MLALPWLVRIIAICAIALLGRDYTLSILFFWLLTNFLIKRHPAYDEAVWDWILGIKR